MIRMTKLRRITRRSSRLSAFKQYKGVTEQAMPHAPQLSTKNKIAIKNL